MSSESEYKKLLVISTLIGLIGSLALVLGVIFNSINIDLNVLDFAIIAWSAGIFIICLITFLGSLTPVGFVFSDERPSFFSIALFILAPTILVSQYNTPMYYLLEIGSELLGAGNAGFTTYLVFIGIVLLLVAFILLTWIFLWKRRTSASEIYFDDTSEIGLVRFFRILTSALVIAAGVGIILGFLISYSTITPGSLLMAGVGSTLDFSALAFIIYIIGIVLTAIIMLLGNIGRTKIPRTELSLVALLTTILALPGYSPPDVSLTVWSSPVYKLLEFGKNKIGELSFIGWVLIISISVMILAFLLSVVTYFMKTSATYESRRARAPRVRKTRLPSGPPSATVHDMAPPSGALADQLSSSMGTTIPSTPPSGTMSAETPTCPFCGKNLRYIEEYQRWYCDSCSQYV